MKNKRNYIYLRYGLSIIRHRVHDPNYELASINKNGTISWTFSQIFSNKAKEEMPYAIYSKKESLDFLANRTIKIVEISNMFETWLSEKEQFDNFNKAIIKEYSSQSLCRDTYMQDFLLNKKLLDNNFSQFIEVNSSDYKKMHIINQTTTVYFLKTNYYITSIKRPFSIIHSFLKKSKKNDLFYEKEINKSFLSAKK